MIIQRAKLGKHSVTSSVGRRLLDGARRVEVEALSPLVGRGSSVVRLNDALRVRDRGSALRSTQGKNTQDTKKTS